MRQESEKTPMFSAKGLVPIGDGGSCEVPNSPDSANISAHSSENTFPVEYESGGGSSATSELVARRLENLPRMREAVRVLLECLGENVEREGLLKTPARVAKSLLALTAGERGWPDTKRLHDENLLAVG